MKCFIFWLLIDALLILDMSIYFSIWVQIQWVQKPWQNLSPSLWNCNLWSQVKNNQRTCAQPFVISKSLSFVWKSLQQSSGKYWLFPSCWNPAKGGKKYISSLKRIMIHYDLIVKKFTFCGIIPKDMFGEKKPPQHYFQIPVNYGTFIFITIMRKRIFIFLHHNDSNHVSKSTNEWLYCNRNVC